jgi:hypothetical protein
VLVVEDCDLYFVHVLMNKMTNGNALTEGGLAVRGLAAVAASVDPVTGGVGACSEFELDIMKRVGFGKGSCSGVDVWMFDKEQCRGRKYFGSKPMRLRGIGHSIGQCMLRLTTM